MEFEKQLSSLSLKQNLKIICASSCCCDCEEEEDEIQKPLEQHSNSSTTTQKRSRRRHSLTSWLKSELAHLFSSKQGRNNNRRRSNNYNNNNNNKFSEFKYDPFSYALNFEDDDSHLDDYPLRDFSSRLPSSPVKQNNIYNTNVVVVSTQISTWS